jgi:hypothetical protein
VTLQNGLERLLEVLQSENFFSFANGEELKSTIAEAVLISPTVHERLPSSAEVCTFHIHDDNSTAKDFSHLLDSIHSRILTDFSKDEQTSFLSLCVFFGDIRLTFLLLGSLHGIGVDQKVREAKFSDSSIKEVQQIEKGMFDEIVSLFDDRGSTLHCDS